MYTKILTMLLLLAGTSLTAQSQTQDVFEIYCGESITLMPDGGALGTNAKWIWYTGSCGGTKVSETSSYTVSPKSSATYYVRAEGSCGTTTCRSVVVTIKPPSFSIVSSAAEATEGCLITYVAKGYPAGGTILWSGATSIGSNAATITMRQTAATTTVNGAGNYYLAYATYTIAAGNECKASASDRTRYTSTCPYTGSDLIAGSCYQDGTGAGNWRARITDARISGTAEINANEGRKFYNIVQMPDGKWWMAKNVDYRKGLTWYADAGSYTSNYVGMYWCPGANATTISTKEGCNTYGALYPQATAVSPAGTGTPAALTSADPSGVQGICPANWHLPSDTEWGKMLDCAEGDCGSGIHYPVPLGYVGKSGRQLKSKNICPVDNLSCTTLSNEKWFYGNLTAGTDYWGFGMAPGGARDVTTKRYVYLGTAASFWSSSTISATTWYYDSWEGYFSTASAQRGFAARCVRN